MSDDWDLHAVVRGCCTATASATATVTTTGNGASQSSLMSFTADSTGLSPVPGWNLFSAPDTFDARSSCAVESSRDPYKSFFFKGFDSFSLQTNSPVSPLYPVIHNHQREDGGKNNGALDVAVSPPVPNPKSGPPRSKRRKIQHKRVCHVPAEALNSDVWAWRKYGQKPIKGSPYPRGYYRCSTSKGCSARKQVERNRSDPKMFIITYTSEHNHPAPTHRNSLAGVSRQKHADVQPPSGVVDSPKPSTVTAEEGQKPEDLAVEDFEIVDDNELPSLSDTVLSDDIFEQLESFGGDSSSADFPANFLRPWVVGDSIAPSSSI